MKFNCGDNSSERAFRDLLKRYTEATHWHDYFAWWPTRVGPNDCRWLETIERRFTAKIEAFIWFNEYHWEYRAKP